MNVQVKYSYLKTSNNPSGNHANWWKKIILQTFIEPVMDIRKIIYIWLKVSITLAINIHLTFFYKKVRILSFVHYKLFLTTKSGFLNLRKNVKNKIFYFKIPMIELVLKPILWFMWEKKRWRGYMNFQTLYVDLFFSFLNNFTEHFI